MKDWTGVGTPERAPNLTAAPLQSSSSEGAPAAMSRCSDEVPSGGRESAIANARVTASPGRTMPRARATSATSCMARRSSFRVSGSVRTGPTGMRQTAQTPPMEQISQPHVPDLSGT